MEVSTNRLSQIALVAAAVLAADQSFGAPDIVIDTPFVAGKYYEQNGARTCANADDCTLRFSALPAGKALSIRQVSCTLHSGSRPAAAYLGTYLSASRPRERQKPLPLAFVSSQSSPALAYEFVVFADTGYPLATRPTVWISFPESTGSVLKCQITGALSP
jgi:hypothetical protein